MFGLIKEGFIAASLFYFELSIKQMGALHDDLPGNIIKARDLRERLNQIRGLT